MMADTPHKAAAEKDLAERMALTHHSPKYCDGAGGGGGGGVEGS